MAASIPHQYYPHNYIDNFSTGFYNYDQNLQMVPLMSSCEMTNNSPVSVSAFAEQFDVFDSMAVPVMSGFDMGYYDFEHGESYFSGLVPSLWSAQYQRTFDNWEIQDKSTTKGHEEPEVKVVRYSAEEKKDRILRYLKKRNQRNFNKTIKYACRKTLADKRIRIRGRFAKNQEPCDDETATKGCDNSCQQDNSFYNDHFQMKFDFDSNPDVDPTDDELWQAAMANLVHFPFTSS